VNSPASFALCSFELMGLWNICQRKGLSKLRPLVIEDILRENCRSSFSVLKINVHDESSSCFDITKHGMVLAKSLKDPLRTSILVLILRVNTFLHSPISSATTVIDEASLSLKTGGRMSGLESY
jgi:hypothetical protein